MHQTGKAEASTFWAGTGAVRRVAFERVGGFDEQRFPRPSIEDIELGYRLRQAGYRIFLDKSLQSMHLKQWTLRSVIRTDIIHRAVPWSRLIIESGKGPDDLNLQTSQRVSVVLTGIGGLLLLTSLFRPWLLLPATVRFLPTRPWNFLCLGLSPAPSAVLHLLRVELCLCPCAVEPSGRGQASRWRGRTDLERGLREGSPLRPLTRPALAFKL
jgi:hypothetical protein